MSDLQNTLDKYDAGPLVLGLPDSETIVDAARLVANGDTVGRCTTHDMPFYSDEPGCEKVWSSDPCVRIRVVVVPVEDTE